jgi:hypothetical protein
MQKEIIIPIAPAGLTNLAAYGLDLAIQAEQNGILFTTPILLPEESIGQMAADVNRIAAATTRRRLSPGPAYRPPPKAIRGPRS